VSSRLPGFYRLGIAERRQRVLAATGLPAAALDALEPGALTLATADGMIENVIGTFALPFAIAANFRVDGSEVLVPMAIEEPSVVAAASNAARMAAPAGFTTIATRPVMIGQIQVVEVADVDDGAAAIRASAADLLGDARRLVPRLAERGGGPIALDVRILARPPGPDGGVIVVHLHVDCCDAMGANLVNSLCEALADRVAALAGGRAGLRILSNLTDGRTITVHCRVADAALAPTAGARPTPPAAPNGDAVRSTDAPTAGADVRRAIAAASRFAELDPYRAATHNKGIMNGVDAVLLATGQDWRAVEAGAHAFASLTGTYRPLATWREDVDEAGHGGLVGELIMPLAVGTVGGALHAHPGARLALALANVEHAERLAAIVACAGLATNLAALRALATEGIQRGHMALHARSLALAAGATGVMIDRVAAELAASGDVKAERARELVAKHTAAQESR
jgi:hydroxymethylglutaryl-CoA reductase